MLSADRKSGVLDAVLPRSAPWILAGVLIGVLSACSNPPEPTPVSSSPPDAPAASATLPPSSVVDSSSALAIRAVPDPDWVMATPGGVWVANVDPGLVRYGPDGAITAQVPTGEITSAMEVGFGALWVPDLGGTRVLRVDLADPSKQATISIPDGSNIPQESSLAVTDDAIWALTTAGSLMRIDPSSNTATAAFDAPEDSTAVRGGFGSLWVTRYLHNSVDRIDPATGKRQARVTVGAGPDFLTVNRDAVWAMNQNAGTVSRIDPATSKVVATIRASGAGVDGGDIAASDDAVWVRTTAELATRIETSDNTVTRVLGPPSGSGSIAVAVDGSVWISAHDVKAVWRVPAG